MTFGTIKSLMLILSGFILGFVTASYLKNTTPVNKTEPAITTIESEFIAVKTATQIEPTTQTPQAPISQGQLLSTLLNTKQYDEALTYLSNNESPEFKQIFYRHLDTLINQPSEFKDLAYLYLDYYFDDIHTRLELAKLQHKQNLTTEALLSFDLAYQYSSEKSRSQVRQYYQAFIDEVDTALRRDGTLHQLVEFYRTARPLAVSDNEHIFREIELNVMLDQHDIAEHLLKSLLNDSVLKERAQLALNELASGNTHSATATLWQSEIPLTPSGYHYLLDVTFDNNTLPLLLDTGASLTVISETTFKQLHGAQQWQFVSDEKFNTAAGQIIGKIYLAPILSLGGYSFRDVHIAVTPMPSTAEQKGLLGMNILREFHFQIDQTRHKLKVTPRK